MTTVTSPITSLKDAIESRDAEGVTAWYADNAVLTILDRDNPPAAPASYRGLEAIGAYYRDICGRNMEHSVEDLVSTNARAWLHAALSLSGRNPGCLRDRRSFG